MRVSPQNEKRRLEVLWEHDIFGSPPESTFDLIAALAAELCGAPIAAVTFIDEDRQWFKARVGLDVSEISRDVSFCSHALSAPQPLIVPDTTKDPRFASNPMVKGEPHLRFYAGVPLIEPGGHALGTICVLDKVTRTLTDSQVRSLEKLAQHTIDLLQLRRRVRDAIEIQEQQKNLGRPYRLIFDSNPHPMWVFHRHTLQFLDVNEAAIAHYGYSREEFLNLTISDIRPAEDVARHAEYHRKILSGEIASGMEHVPFWRHQKKDGTIIEVEIKWTPIVFKGIPAQLVSADDITERRKSELQTAEFARVAKDLSSARSAEQAGRIITGAADILIGWDACSFDLYSTERHEVYSVLSVDLIDGKKQDVPPAYSSSPPPPRIAKAIKDGGMVVLRTPEEISASAGLRPFGSMRPSASIVLVPIHNREKTLGILSVQSYKFNAYTEKSLQVMQALADHCGGALERISAEEALRLSEVRFHSVWENSVDGMRLTDENGVIVAINKSFCNLVEMPAEDLVGKFFTVTYADSAKHSELLEKYRRRFKDRTVAKYVERKMVFRSGKTAELEGANSFVDLDGERPLLLGLFRDVTEQKHLENQLRQAQKMESVGQLAGGIAHDFNNLLTVIQGHAALLQSVATTGEAAESLQQISIAAERSANLTRQLLTFSRRQVMQRRPLDLKEVVDEMSKMLRRILGEDIVLTVENSSDLPRIDADRGMMEQIILNLAVNSRDAMPRGGRLLISTKTMRVDENYVRRNSDAFPGEFVCLKVADSGCGIPAKNLPHIFEPFFTTKEVGKGTGLGLATVYGIVKQHSGWIEVTSEIGKGSHFEIFFPRSAERSDLDGKSGEQTVPRGSETILLVEDEAPLRQLVQFLLERLGYRVLEAESGPAALTIWRKHDQKIDLLLTDLVMPEGMTGSELSEVLRREDPQLKVIFTSGYSADIIGKDFVRRHGLNFLQKPYHPDKLARTVRDCLDGK